MKRPIAISLAPNLERDDVILALKTLIKPVSWYDHSTTEKLENDFAKYFGKEYKAIAVNSGRSAEYLILKSLGIKKGDEVILQALTCVVVPNPIVWLGAKPVYADIDNSYNIDPQDLGEKINKSSRAIIVQNSFGIPADYSEINKVIKKKKIKKKIWIIEDCALSLGAIYNDKKLGTIGDVAFFSFGRDKVISSVFGGIILCKNKDLYQKIKEERDKLDYPSPFWLLQQLMHPILFYLILPLYDFGYGKFTLGKILLFTFQELRFLSKAIDKKEKDALQPKLYPKKMPGAIAELAMNQLKKLDRFNKKRSETANKYFKYLSKKNIKLPPNRPGSIWLRFPILTEDSQDLIDFAQENKIILGDWYRNVVTSVKEYGQVFYRSRSCKKAEEYSKKILNLPTYPTMKNKDLDEVIELLNSWKTIK